MSEYKCDHFYINTVHEHAFENNIQLCDPPVNRLIEKSAKSGKLVSDCNSYIDSMRCARVMDIPASRTKTGFVLCAV